MDDTVETTTGMVGALREFADALEAAERGGRGIRLDVVGRFESGRFDGVGLVATDAGSGAETARLDVGAWPVDASGRAD